ncbi:kinase-like protein [Amniculicola lignicola CBS 123094]|uniref:non-specific serine/threonine protein kinase n=1 Tax=Amniculicola lignicola CBS 123094 TaxID=1392246 RepID=A0A6A5WFY7_9PLEO|nr:kinase-like protein [Amniculicola lignicola CBS 123094]
MATGLSDSDLVEIYRIESEFEAGKTIEIKRDGDTEERIVWSWVEELGYGAYGEVWLEKDLSTGKARAVKRVRKRNKMDVGYKKELSALRILSKHPICFVDFYGYFEHSYHPNSFCFAMEYFPLGDLYNVFREGTTGAPCTEEDAKEITNQILCGLRIMHGKGFAHRDLKPQNIFVTQRHPFWWIKLGDFGISKQVLDEETALRTIVGTQNYLAPEVIQAGEDYNIESYTNAVDMWSLGCVVYWLLTKSIPFSNRGVLTLANFVRDASLFPMEKLQQNNVTAECISFLKQLLVIQPSKRMTAVSAQEHIWLEGARLSVSQIEEYAMSTKRRPNISPTDPIIAVMGVTGSGKSTFINHLALEKLQIGHELRSVTRSVEMHECMYDNKRLFLVDTPGFDDTDYSDTDVLRELAAWLAEAHSQEIKLSGIIYLHRISDTRMQGSSLRNLRLFRHLCGKDLNGISLVTTMWDRVSEYPDQGERREESLISTREFWGGMIELGAIALRHDGSRTSAENIVRRILAGQRPGTLQIQQEMVAEGVSLADTSAGQAISEDLRRAKERYEAELNLLAEDMAQAILDKDTTMYEMIEQEQKSLEARFANTQRAEAELGTSRAALQRQLDARWAGKWERLLAVMRETEVKLVQDELMLQQAQPVGQSQQNLLHALELQRQTKLELDGKAESHLSSSCLVM